MCVRLMADFLFAGMFASMLFVSQLVITAIVPLVVVRNGAPVTIDDFSSTWYYQVGTSLISNFVLMGIAIW